MKIHIPNTAFLGNIDSFLKGFDPANPNTLTITSNKKWISIHPVVLSLLAALSLKVKSENIQCEKFEAASAHYLQRMGLFQFLRIEPATTIKEHESTGRFIPLTQIKSSDELTEFLKEMTPLLHLESKNAEPIRYIMSELVRNVLEHSFSEYGAIVCAQYYFKSNTIRIGIADTGIGIWKSIRQSYKPKNDLEAIQLALTPGITGTTKKEGGTEYNAGAGLFFIKSIAKMSRDFFVIYSGDALFKLLKAAPGAKQVRLCGNPFDDRHSASEGLPPWRGTAVGIDIALEPKQGFSLLLDHIRSTYVSALKEQKQRRHKKPRFL